MRQATAALHDRLDREMGMLDLTDRQDYGRFLQIQLAARIPLEQWMAGLAPAHLVPPPASPLLIDDLVALGRPVSLAPVPFDMPADADPLGGAWALAGSHLGNRSMLAGLAKRGASDRLPTRFLADPAAAQYWLRLKPLLEEPASDRETARAIAAAEAVFAHFLAVVARTGERLAA